MQLREYQNLIISSVREKLRTGCRSVLIHSPVGSGKTALTAYILSRSAQNGKQCWFMVHRRELIKQSLDTLTKFGTTPSVVSSGFEYHENKIQIVGVQSLKGRKQSLYTPDIIVWDECHHLGAKTWEAIYSQNPQAIHIGLSASPERLDGKGLRKYFSEIVHGPSVEWLINSGFLAKFKYLAPHRPDLTGVHKRGGDYASEDVQEIMSKVTGDVVQHYTAHAKGKRAIMFCVNIKHSIQMVDAFKAAGLPAEHVDGGVSSADRDAAISRFRNGETLVLSNVDLFGEGFDVPAAEAVILCRPTQSLALHTQQVGRSLRPHQDKEQAVILDHAGNAYRHGLPDTPHSWNLDGKQERLRRDKEYEENVTVCKICFSAMEPGRSICPYCKSPLEKKDRTPKMSPGELRELKKIEIAKQSMERKQARTREDLVRLGMERGYQYPGRWADHIIAGREKRGFQRRK
jgi:superfamily II DNA or RNA helicase